MNRKVTVNGKEIEVSEDIYQAILESDDPSLYYNSSSKGKIRLDDMADDHLKNAFLKTLRNLLTDKLDNMKTQNLKELTHGGKISVQVTDSYELDKLFSEMQKRVSNEAKFDYIITDFFATQ